MLFYAVTIFLSAFLLFQVQLVIAKYILPWFGGTPAVWTTCMLFFQVLLMGGYAYSHLIVSRLRPRGQRAIHLVVLAASLCLLAGQLLAWHGPILPDPGWKPSGSDFPVLRILGLLAVAVGLPFFVLSSTSSLLQAWFARTRPGRSPYRLYALSNAGSLLGLISYPFLVEPALTLRWQAGVWSSCYAIFALCCGWCAVRAVRAGEPLAKTGPDVPRGEPATADGVAGAAGPIRTHRYLWLGLPVISCVLLLATTNQISEEIAVVPFLWVMPLSVYLLSFIICFDNRRWYVRPVFIIAALLGMALIGVLTLEGMTGLAAAKQAPEWVQRLVGEDGSVIVAVNATAKWVRDLVGEGGSVRRAVASSIALFIACMICHGELARLKPAARYLTSFYLRVSVGGALGGVFVAVIAPRIFNGLWELYLGYIACGAVLVLVMLLDRRSWLNGEWRWVWRPLAALLLMILVVAPYTHLEERYSGALCMRRNFYGILRVEEFDADKPERHRNVLYHASTVHGYQLRDPAHRRTLTTYYTERSGVYLAIANHPRRKSGGMRLGIVGLGAGTAAAFGQAGDYVRFYEINPVIVELAIGPKSYFSFLEDTPAKFDIVMGDARIMLERELERGEPQRFDVIMLDAFSGDTPPLHLLTKQAFDIYLRHLRKGGVLAVHVSNRYLDMEPVVWRLADELKLGGVMISTGDDKDDPRVWGSDWMLLSYDESFMKQDAIAGAATERGDSGKSTRLWTDDYSNLFQILR